MWLGYNTNGFAHHRLDEAIRILADLGYEGVAITVDTFALNPYEPGIEREAEHIRALLDAHRMRCIIETGSRFLLDSRRKHQPTLMSSTIEERARRRDYLQRCQRIAVWLGCDVLSFWSGSATESLAPDVGLSRLVEECQKLHHAEGMRFAFEPEPGMFIDTMERFALLHDRVERPYFGLTLDVGHLHCNGEWPIAQHIERWRDWLWNIHIEDMKYGVHDHLMFGAGEMNFADIFAALQRIDYAGGVCVELSRHSHDAVETARRSLTFLRQFTTNPE